MKNLFSKMLLPAALAGYALAQTVGMDIRRTQDGGGFPGLRDIDRGLLKHMLLSLGIEAGYFGTKEVRANREKYNCNIPWTILFDPTSACNLKCKGCWAAEYGHHQSLSLLCQMHH